jgi:hypothetical protein
MVGRSGTVRGFGASLLLAVGAVVGLGGGTAAVADPPGIPSAATARTELAALRVAPDGSMDGYSRDLFPHWSTVEGSCNTRETVLRRDGDDVEVGSNCAPTSGSWHSPYDGDTWTQASDVDIDHMVPLAAAWRTGARSWTTARRQAFANDLATPQLWAVTDDVNQAKGDKTPDAWKPPLRSHWCQYARAYTRVKYRYELTVTSGEQAALSSMLATC